MPIDTSQSTVIGGVNCYDTGLVETPYSIRGTTAVRTIECNWSDRYTLANYLAGAPTIPGAPSAPQQYPNLKGLFVGEIRIEGKGAHTHDTAKNISKYDLAVLTVTYYPPNITGIGGSV